MKKDTIFEFEGSTIEYLGEKNYCDLFKIIERANNKRISSIAKALYLWWYGRDLGSHLDIEYKNDIIILRDYDPVIQKEAINED